MRRVRMGLAALALTTVPVVAHAFCGFYVGGADAKLFNNATQVVLLRDGTRTVLSMQNNYQGPPSDFAMVVPVPVVLQEENVKTLPREIFERIDLLDAPRLVEYWEKDPCEPERPYKLEGSARMGGGAPETENGTGDDLGVKIEAQFTVGEYEIVILSASDSQGLDTWLRREKYKIPQAAEPLLRPYVAAGMKFFVAKVNVKKVTFKDGMAMLSPLRFHYDTDQFALPVRLGLVNSAGTQDLIVHILAPGTRYEVANYGNVTIPTNIDVEEAARDQFGAFYAALFDATIAKNPGAVITEYSWDAGSCDPCPTPPLEDGELATLGGDVVPTGSDPYSYVLTRLHARYGKDALGEDLVFRTAAAIAGGREWRNDAGLLEKGAVTEEGGMNNFQGRYAIRHAWKGAIACEEPIRGRWGGPPGDEYDENTGTPRAARDLAFAPRGELRLGLIVKEDVPEIGVVAGVAGPPSGKVGGKRGSCACDVGGRRGGVGMAFGALGLVAVLLVMRRRRG